MLHLLQTIKFFVQSGGESGSEDVSEIIVHHIGDHVIHDGYFGLGKLIGYINEHFLNQKFFGIFDLRITDAVLMMWIVFIILLLIFIPIAKKIKNAKYGSSSKWVNLWEILVSYIHDEIVAPNFDPPYDRKAMPYMCTIFFFVLFCNLLGLIPGFGTATGKLSVTCGLAVLTLVGIISVGSVKQGPFWIFTGIVPHGVPMALFPLMWPMEVFSFLIKTFALTIRLFANMIAGHIVIIMFIMLVMLFQNYAIGIGSVTMSLMIYLLELLVAFIQAYIFTMLSSMFISSSLHAH